jgi:ATP-dependent DNA ligase
VKNLNDLQAQCLSLGIVVDAKGRASKEPYIAALRSYHWHCQHPGEPLPEQIEPMLLGNWNDLAADEAAAVEEDHHSWCVQPKMDGVRVLVNVGQHGVRITGRNASEVTYRLTEHQDNLRHLVAALAPTDGYILDGELVCPVSQVNTGSTITNNALPAAVAILATTPENAQTIQVRYAAFLELNLFDVLRFKGRDVTHLPLYERLSILDGIVQTVGSQYVKAVPTGIVGKRAIHDRVLNMDGEGTVWKRLDRPYQPGRRVRHWLKRKRGIEIEALVSGFKNGSEDRGHRELVGAVEFSVFEDGAQRPVAWVSGWSDHERQAMTVRSESGGIELNPDYLGRRAVVVGQDESARSRRLRHARLKHWVA